LRLRMHLGCYTPYDLAAEFCVPGRSRNSEKVRLQKSSTLIYVNCGLLAAKDWLMLTKLLRGISQLFLNYSNS